MPLEVRSVKQLLGTPVPYAYAVKAGPWLFLTGHEAYDWRTGMADDAVSGPPGYPLFGARHKSRREAEFIFDRMRRVLDEFGSDFAHSVRLDQYYPNPRAVAAYHLARHDAFGDYIPPSTSVVMERCFSGGSTLSTSLIAVVPSAEYQIRKIYPPGVASAPTSGFVPAVVCNEFVFVAGQMAHTPGAGLDPRVVVPEHAAWAGIPIRKQTEFLILEKLKPTLEAAGSSLQQSVKAQIYLADIADMPDCLDVWNRHYAGIPCAITVVPTKSFATVGGIIEINLIALTDAARRRKEVIDADIPGMAAFGPSLKVGEFLFPSGLMALGHDGRIAGSGVSPDFPGLAYAGYRQAEVVYLYAEALCRAAGTTMDRVLRAQYFAPDIAAFLGIAMAWSARYGKQPHPFVCVQTPQSMPASGAAVIADFWISTMP